jgi:hypothetical protein
MRAELAQSRSQRKKTPNFVAGKSKFGRWRAPPSRAGHTTEDTDLDATEHLDNDEEEDEDSSVDTSAPAPLSPLPLPQTRCTSTLSKTPRVQQHTSNSDASEPLSRMVATTNTEEANNTQYGQGSNAVVTTTERARSICSRPGSNVASMAVEEVHDGVEGPKRLRLSQFSGHGETFTLFSRKLAEVGAEMGTTEGNLLSAALTRYYCHLTSIRKAIYY